MGAPRAKRVAPHQINIFCLKHFITQHSFPLIEKENLLAFSHHAQVYLHGCGR